MSLDSDRLWEDARGLWPSEHPNHYKKEPARRARPLPELVTPEPTHATDALTDSQS